jgi:hypothetical protein
MKVSQDNKTTKCVGSAWPFIGKRTQDCTAHILYVSKYSFFSPTPERERESGYEEGKRKRGTYKEERNLHKNVNILLLS